MFLGGVCAAASTILVVAIAKFSMHISLLFALVLVSINDKQPRNYRGLPTQAPQAND